MEFRKDINGLRAIAVIAVVLFHFNPTWMPGGFAGVDVFFVISGFLMTGIIFRGIEKGNFSILRFYVDRGNRIIPALAVLCIFLFFVGWLYLSPLDYKVLGKHISSSMSFLSNVQYWREAGYFDASSHDKWLLHTWSLSVEWQFYIIYPLVLIALNRFVPVESLKICVLLATLLGFVFCIVATYKYPNAAYYLLPTRAWEMMVGGVAYLYPVSIKKTYKRYIELLALALILLSYFTISKDSPWPGYLALLPVFGAYLIIVTHRENSFITGNVLFQNLGSWSYSIYLWHWPLAVAGVYFSLGNRFVYLGIVVAILLGWLSSKYIEKIRFRRDFISGFDYLNSKPIYIVVLVTVVGSLIYIKNGFSSRYPERYLEVISNIEASPLRGECHISEYKKPQNACAYFVDNNVKYAVLGDSHSTEIAYALAEKLKPLGVGVKQFSFSSCVPSYNQKDNFSKCSKWYNDVVDTILSDGNIDNVVLNHYFTNAIFGGSAEKYPELFHTSNDFNAKSMFNSIDELVFLLAKNKKNVYLFYPIPELPRDIRGLLHINFLNGLKITRVTGTEKYWYEDRNKGVIRHFNSVSYPKNVHLINSADSFCDNNTCYAVMDGLPLYFDSHHPSLIGARKLVELMDIIH